MRKAIHGLLFSLILATAFVAQAAVDSDDYGTCVTFMKMSTADQLNVIEQTNRKFGDHYTLSGTIAHCRTTLSQPNEQGARGAQSSRSCTNSWDCPSLYQCIDWSCEEIGGATGCNTGHQCSPGEVCCGSVCEYATSCD